MHNDNPITEHRFDAHDYFLHFKEALSRDDFLRCYQNEVKDVIQIDLVGRPFRTTTPIWMLHNWLEIFEEQPYLFSCNTTKPVVIDCGANLGLSILFFKQQYPNAEIIGFEPDPVLFECLGYNTQHVDSTLYQAAVWKKDGHAEFYADHSLGGCLDETKSKDRLKVQVKTLGLARFLDRKIDLLKIDIEGAEYEVLNAVRNRLKLVQKIFIEYHGNPNQPQHLPEILSILKTAGFRFYITEGWKNMKHPFVEYTKDDFLFDLQLNIFAYRR